MIDGGMSSSQTLVGTTDPASLQKIKHIIRTQFDYEILLKRAELKAIRDEIARGEDQLARLHYLAINGELPAPARVSTPRGKGIFLSVAAPCQRCLVADKGVFQSSYPIVHTPPQLPSPRHDTSHFPIWSTHSQSST